MRQDFENILAAAKVYTNYLGYGQKRTETSPNVGISPFATIATFSAFNGELILKIDFDEKWIITIERTGTAPSKKRIEADTKRKIANKLQAILSTLPRNDAFLTTESFYIRNYDKGLLHIVEREFNECIRPNSKFNR